MKKVGKSKKNKPMEDWLNLINAETEGEAIGRAEKEAEFIKKIKLFGLSDNDIQKIKDINI